MTINDGIGNVFGKLGRDYGQYSPEILPGMIHGIGEGKILQYLNAAGSPQTFTITLPASVDADGKYSLLFSSKNLPGSGSMLLEATVSGSPNTAELRTALLSTIRGKPDLFGALKVVETSATVITVEIKSAPGQVFPYSISAPSNATTTNDLTIAETVPWTQLDMVPFGLFLAKKASYKDGVLSLPSANTDSIVGVSFSTHFTERHGRGLVAQGGYRPFDSMNVLVDTVALEGIGVLTVEDSLTDANNGALYVVASGDNRGYLTTVSTNNIDISSRVRVAKNTMHTFGDNITLVTFKPA